MQFQILFMKLKDFVAGEAETNVFFQLLVKNQSMFTFITISLVLIIDIY